jgi:hypothetical protein
MDEAIKGCQSKITELAFTGYLSGKSTKIERSQREWERMTGE